MARRRAVRWAARSDGWMVGLTDGSKVDWTVVLRAWMMADLRAESWAERMDLRRAGKRALHWVDLLVVLSANLWGKRLVGR